MQPIKTEIEKTLDSLSGIHRAQAPKDFHLSLQRRMKSAIPINSKWLVYLRAGIAAMIVLGAFNAYMLLSNKEDTTTIADFKTEYLDNSITLLDY
jgi:hypothetical protein